MEVYSLDLVDDTKLLLLLSRRSSERSFGRILVVLSLSEEDSLSRLRLLIVKIESLILLYSLSLGSLLDWGMLSTSEDSFWEEVVEINTPVIISNSRELDLLV